MKILIFTFSILMMSIFLSCISSNIEQFYPEDYGYFDLPKDINIFKATSDGMIDSTQYYSTKTYNTTYINKTGLARMTTKSEINEACFRKACKKSTELGYEYILVIGENESVYEFWYDIRYKYQILFIPINKNEITTELHKYKIFKNSLFYKPKKQQINNSISIQKNQNNETTNFAINQKDRVINYSVNGFSVEFGNNGMIVDYKILHSKQDFTSIYNLLDSMGYKVDTTYYNNTNLSLAVIEGMKHFKALGCYGKITDNNYSCIVVNYLENNSYNTSIFSVK